ncbi:MAG: hypothetical protein HC809_16095, partial [Gammaproteobacteria bacterium]|nr:hypothetical protein [Gammaproteobacteria bacterium]
GLDIEQRGSRLFSGLELHVAVHDAAAALWEGLAAAHNRFVVLQRTHDSAATRWRISMRR